MTNPSKTPCAPRAAIVAMACCLLAGTATAQPWHREPDRAEFRGGLHLDERYHHDHYYPVHGAAVRALPAGALSVGFHGDPYFFHGGVWFRPSGGRYFVVAPPLGIVVPVLPPAYTTLWIAGTPYYYANGDYYVATPGQGYTVVAPPPGADSAQAVPPAAQPKAAPDPVIYPRNGQTAAQTEADRQECNRWATTQPSAVADAQVFQRAAGACMEGRGYTLR